MKIDRRDARAIWTLGLKHAREVSSNDLNPAKWFASGCLWREKRNILGKAIQECRKIQ